MVNHIRLLIVEDNMDEQKTWDRQLEQHNAIALDSGEFTIGHTFAETKESALTQIEQNDFDAAIVDLGLATVKGHKEQNTNGNDVVRRDAGENCHIPQKALKGAAKLIFRLPND